MVTVSGNPMTLLTLLLSAVVNMTPYSKELP